MRMSRVRPGWLTPQVVDVLIAFVLLVELELEAGLDTVIPESHRLPAAIGALLLVAPVAVRRRWPAGALVASAAVAGALQAPWTGNVLNGMTGTILPVLLLALTAGERLSLRRGLAATTTAAALIAGGALWSTAGPPIGTSFGAEAVSAVSLPLVFWALGWMWQQRSRRTAAFHELVASIERERERSAEAAAARERVAIGRELQDIIAQNVSAIIIQAGGARQLIGVEADRAAAAILNVERAGREALADLRRTLGLLRTDEDPRAPAPQPGLAQLESLLDSSRKRGLDCGLCTQGEQCELATGIDLLAYRVIEAAINTADENHQPIEVTVEYAQARLDVEIIGRGPVAGLAEQLHGIRERVSLYNGSLAIGPLNTGRYAIRAHLPLGVPAR